MSVGEPEEGMMPREERETFRWQCPECERTGWSWSKAGAKIGRKGHLRNTHKERPIVECREVL
jgi:hypothetical protein